MPARARKLPVPHPAAHEARAKVFWSGRSQAVRLPKSFRLDTAEVKIRREGRRIVLEPAPHAVDRKGWPVGFADQMAAGKDAAFDLGDRSRLPERKDPLVS